MRGTLSAALLTLLFVSVFTMAFSAQQVNAAQGKVGVKVGDWAKYDYVYNYTSDDPAHPPPEIPNVEQTRLIEVLSITGTNITYQVTDYLSNGTESSLVGWTDVRVGFILSFFTTANLSVGDLVYVGRLLYPVNATLKRSYAGVAREVNYFGRTVNGNRVNGLLVNISMHIYWDKVTGVLTEMSTSQHFTNITHGYTTSNFMQGVIKETNIWSPTYVSARVNIIPGFLNLKSRGRWLRACIKIPRGYDVKDIDTATVRLNGTIKAELKPRIVRVKWRNSNRVLMVKFERQAVIDLLKDRQLNKFGTVTVTIAGSFRDGTQFEGSDSIKIWRSWKFPFLTFSS